MSSRKPARDSHEGVAWVNYGAKKYYNINQLIN